VGLSISFPAQEPDFAEEDEHTKKMLWEIGAGGPES
jgi:hypothetical protein